MTNATLTGLRDQLAQLCRALAAAMELPDESDVQDEALAQCSERAVRLAVGIRHASWSEPDPLDAVLVAEYAARVASEGLGWPMDTRGARVKGAADLLAMALEG